MTPDCTEEEYDPSMIRHLSGSCGLYTKPRSITLSSSAGESVSGSLPLLLLSPWGSCRLMLREAGGRTGCLTLRGCVCVCVREKQCVKNTWWWMCSLRTVHSTDFTQEIAI